MIVKVADKNQTYISSILVRNNLKINKDKPDSLSKSATPTKIILVSKLDNLKYFDMFFLLKYFVSDKSKFFFLFIFKYYIRELSNKRYICR